MNQQKQDNLDTFNESDQRQDNTTLTNALAASGGVSPFVNPVLGIGTDRDPISSYEIQSSRRLSDVELGYLFEGSKIIYNLVTTYPLETKPPIITFSYSDNENYQQALKTQLDNLAFGSFQSNLIDAAIEARLYGKAYLVIGVNDNKDPKEPIDYENIDSLNYVKATAKTQLIYDKEKQLFELQNQTKTLIHPDRVITIYGSYVPLSARYSALENESGYGSVVQTAFDGLALFMSAMLSTSVMVSDHSIFTYGLDGLSNLVRSGQQDLLSQRFIALQYSKNVLQGIAYDKVKESVGFVERSYNGLGDILERFVEYLIAETGMVRYKILGTANRTGLGAESRGLQDRLEHSTKLRSWQNETLLSPIQRVVRVALQSKNGVTKGFYPTDLSIKFPTVLELTGEEKSSIINGHVSWAQTAINSGLITSLEARKAIFSSDESLIDPVVNLDSRYTEKLENEYDQKKENLTESIIIDPVDLESSELTEEDFEVNSEQNTDQRNDASYWYLVFFEGRNTATVVKAANRNQAIVAARNKKVAGSNGKVIEARKANQAEVTQINKGNWIRTRAKKYGGTSEAKKSDPFTFRPQLKEKVRDSLTEETEETEETEPLLIEIDSKVAKLLKKKLKSSATIDPDQNLLITNEND